MRLEFALGIYRGNGEEEYRKEPQPDMILSQMTTINCWGKIKHDLELLKRDQKQADSGDRRMAWSE